MAGDPRDWMWTEACALLNRAERLHRQFFEPDLASSQGSRWQPPVDIVETEGEVLIYAALPGVEPESVETVIKSPDIIIGGIRRLPDAARGAAIHRLEIPHGRFERRIRLAAGSLRVARQEIVSGCLVLTLSKQR